LTDTIEPTTFEEAADALASARGAGQAVRIRGAGTKAGWGVPGSETSVELRTGSLDEIVEHNVGDLTAVLQAGVPLVRAQSMFAGADQMLALDPPLGEARAATVGGVVATGDCGPLRHRYGGVRDLVIGITVALSDGTIARSGGKVIKNVAGYDLAKLFAGSFGTLGVILAVNVRLHPRAPAYATALGASGDPAVVQAGARALAAAPLEFDALDVAWHAGRGGILARLGGAEARRRAERAVALLREAGLEDVDVVTDDAGLWARQRAGQRSGAGAIVRVSARPSALAGVLTAVDSCGGTLVGRAALGTSYVELEPAVVERFCNQLPESSWSVLLDAPDELREATDPWGAQNGTALELMRRVKRRFDPTATCNPGVYVGGI
jgi:glycolate oxidase FAD binding subunit